MNELIEFLSGALVLLLIAAFSIAAWIIIELLKKKFKN